MIIAFSGEVVNDQQVKIGHLFALSFSIYLNVIKAPAGLSSGG
ncbi:unannotated protein [freshwater metagenome]|uniref:Unannotated protein n=1 Tax=freshwater metagenome TaxID=449393 RepID=A0A6J6EVG5_9ZZZZ